MKLYLDTSVYGGYYDDEFMDDTRLLFDCINKNNIEVIISPIVELELMKARKDVRDTINLIENIRVDDFTQDMEDLSKFYIELSALPPKCEEDARHIAFATIQGATKIVSWNFKHMVNFKRIEDFNVINLRHGYRMINIYTPKQIISAYDEEL